MYKGGDLLKKCYKISVIFVLIIFLVGCTNTQSSSNSNFSSRVDTMPPVSSNTDIVEPDDTTTTTTTTENSSQTSGSTSTTPEITDKPQTTTKPTTTTIKPQTTTTKPQTTTTKKPSAPVVIPVIKTPSSPGKSVFNHDRCIVDYSNASQGYFTVKFFGKTETGIKLMVSCNGVNYFYDVFPDNKYTVFPFNMGNGTYKITVLEIIAGTNKGATLVSGDVKVAMSNGFSPYLYPNQQVNFHQNSAIVNKSAQLCAGKTTDVEKASAIFKYVTNNVKYDYELAGQIQNGTITQYLPSPDKTLSSNKGICYDYASLVAAMCRAQGIPARLIKGYAGSSGVYHAWNQIYLKNIGWVTAEYKSKSGYNTVDATFYAGASNKESITSNFNESYYKTSKIF